MIILMIKLLLLMLPKLQSTWKKTKQSYSGKRKKAAIKTWSNYRTKSKLLQQVFRSGKNMIMLYLKNQKGNPNFKNTKLMVDEWFIKREIQKNRKTFKQEQKQYNGWFQKWNYYWKYFCYS
ncbi:hypothetical protein [Spiroplasma poulsonii]|uniref:hypothetical protein n=1 Tax=Spiroplasma poulsonii TaxID=2138 RepID=UPI001F4CED04|nr:hypothetical protein [Spiroplasma poulsonii]UNF62163.1 hypothetical protein MNU24_01480 [Spiroplasma poulsonii]